MPRRTTFVKQRYEKASAETSENEVFKLAMPRQTTFVKQRYEKASAETSENKVFKLAMPRQTTFVKQRCEKSTICTLHPAKSSRHRSVPRQQNGPSAPPPSASRPHSEISRQQITFSRLGNRFSRQQIATARPLVATARPLAATTRPLAATTRPQNTKRQATGRTPQPASCFGMSGYARKRALTARPTGRRKQRPEQWQGMKAASG